MAVLFLDYYGEDESWLEVSLETFVTLFAKYFCQKCDTELSFVRNCKPINSKNSIETLIKVRKCDATFYEESEIEPEVLNCCLPSLKISSCNLYISGICAVVRYLFRNYADEDRRLLGFRQRSLMSCAEVSNWTKFCELDLINGTRSYISSCGSGNLPDEILKFETQLGQPVCVRNNKKGSKNWKKSPDLNPILRHDFAEGSEMTIADIIIFACILRISMQDFWPRFAFKIPRILNWYRRMISNSRVKFAAEALGFNLSEQDITMSLDVECEFAGIALENNSCIRDEVLVKSRGKNHTHQESIDVVLQKLSDNSIDPLYCQKTCTGQSQNFWVDLPAAAHPREGDLPETRLEHKCQQLENLTCAACSLSKSGDIIVDFCSGGGHLGIMLAVKLPQCRVILVENKEKSVDKALRRIQLLKLDNCIVYQCNLGRFKGPFNTGVALHACGVATDLVMSACIAQRASFVVCPCCYGATRDTHTITHPLSETFKILSKTEYLTLCHAADQTHQNGHKQIQGKHCMGLVDTDRLLCAKSAGYAVTLSTLNPPECTLKNNLLIGIPSSCSHFYLPNFNSLF